MLRFGPQILGHDSIDLLRRIDAPLDDVVPAKRAITLRDLLTFRFALGAVMIWPPAYPIQKAMEAAGLMPGPNPVELTPDDFMKRLGTLPLIDQPGEKNPMGNPNRTIRRKEITELARQTWSRIWSDQMPKDWRVYLVRKTVIQRVHGRSVCGVLLRGDKRILVGRHTKHYSFQTLVHELRIFERSTRVDHGPSWHYEFNRVARPLLGSELQTDI